MAGGAGGRKKSCPLSLSLWALNRRARRLQREEVEGDGCVWQVVVLFFVFVFSRLLLPPRSELKSKIHRILKRHFNPDVSGILTSFSVEDKRQILFKGSAEQQLVLRAPRPRPPSN